MPLGPRDIPDTNIHRLCIRCRRWHWPEEGRDYVVPRIRPFAVDLGRAIAGIEDPVRFMCKACDHKRWWMRAWFLIVATGVGTAAIVLQWAAGR
jgi:hypothetical protein